LHTWGSGRFLGIADDAHYLANIIHGKLAVKDVALGAC